MDQIIQVDNKESKFDTRAGWLVALAALTLAAVGGMVSVSTRAGALENRVSGVEARQNSSDTNQAKIMDKVDTIADAVARIEGKLSK